MVKDNIGLVYVHMKHYVAPHQIPWTRREWEDLVQEGCLGLIRAAQDFKSKGKIPFAAFALPRIHKAIHRVMLQRFGGSAAFAGGVWPAKRSLFGLPERPDWSPRKPRRSAGSQCPIERLGDWWGTNRETLGMRLREKYERAVRRAMTKVGNEEEGDALTVEVIEAIAEDRHLVPDEHARKPYRAIARRTGAPYARVLQLDRLLQLEIRQSLERDPEFAELKRVAFREPSGVDTPAGDALDQQLARLGAAEILQHVIGLSGEPRQNIIDEMFRLAPQSLLESIQRELESMPVEAREQLFTVAASSCSPEKAPQAAGASFPNEASSIVTST